MIPLKRRTVKRWTPDMLRRAWQLNAKGKPLNEIFFEMRREFPGVSKSTVLRNLKDKLKGIPTAEELDLAILGGQLERKKGEPAAKKVKKEYSAFRRIIERAPAKNFQSESLISKRQDKRALKIVMDRILPPHLKQSFDDFFGVTHHRMNMPDIATHNGKSPATVLREVNEAIELLSHHINLIDLVQ